MGNMMSGRNYYHSGVDKSVDWYRRIAELVTDTVTFYRMRGHPQTIAMEQAALALGLNPRRVTKYCYDEHVAATACEYAAVRRARLRQMDFEADDLSRRLLASRARRREMELEEQQLRLDI